MRTQLACHCPCESSEARETAMSHVPWGLRPQSATSASQVLQPVLCLRIPPCVVACGGGAEARAPMLYGTQNHRHGTEQTV